MEQIRTYRYRHKSREGWSTFEVKYRETDLWVRALSNLEKEALTAVLTVRRQIERYIAENPLLLHSLQPLPDDPAAPPIVRDMLRVSRLVDVGPMAAVAGAVAQSVALALKPFSAAVMIENGGDCYLDIEEPLEIGIYAGPNSPFSGRLGLRFGADRFPLGICTSSGTIGHSLSFGKADGVTVVARDAALADAAATMLGNMVRSPSDIQDALDRAAGLELLEGVLITIGDRLGAWGDLEVVPL